MARTNIRRGTKQESAAQAANEALGNSSLQTIPSYDLGLTEKPQAKQEQNNNQIVQETTVSEATQPKPEQPASINTQDKKNIQNSQEGQESPATMRFRMPGDLKNIQPSQTQGKDGRVTFKAPQQDTSAGFNVRDVVEETTEDVNEIDQNPNNYDSYPTPPVVEQSKPIEPKAANIHKTSLQETNDFVMNTPIKEKNNTAIDGLQPLPKSEPVYTTLPTERFSNQQKAEKESVEGAVANKNWTGNGFEEKATSGDSLHPVRPDAASIGTFVIHEIVREPGNNLIDTVNQATNQSFTIEQVLTERGMKSFAAAINSSEIYIVATKSPVPTPESTQGRLLRVHEGRGIRVHPTQTKAWNLDFDGDGVKIQFSYDPRLFRNCMDYMIGIDGSVMLDTDFFPIIDTSNMTMDEFKDLFVNSFLTKVPPQFNGYKRAIAESLYKASKSNSEDDWKGFVIGVDKLASKFKRRTKMMSNILSDVYDDMLFSKRLEADFVYMNDSNVFVETITPEDQYIQMIIADMYAGQLPPNYHDFILGMHKFTGDIEGKNVQFRIGADLAKKIQWHDKLVIEGENFQGKMKELYEKTLDAGMAEMMNNRSYLGDKIRYARRIMQSQVISKVGFPDQYPDLEAFLTVFKEEYMRIKRITDEASLKFTMDMDIDYKSVAKEDDINDRVSSFVNPLIAIYGDYTMQRMFSSNSKIFRREEMLPRYRRMRLKDFAKKNRLNPIQEKDRARNKEGLSRLTYTDEKFTPWDLVLAISDKRTSLASKFNKSLQDMFVEHIEVFKNIEKDSKSRFIDWREYAKDKIYLLQLSGPDMFAYFSMDDAEQFMTSKYGLMLKNAAKKNNADLIGGIRTAMVFQYRMRHIVDTNAAISDLMQNGNFPGDLEQMQILRNQLNNEFEILASSSYLWNAIVKEMRNNNYSFNYIKEMKNEIKKRPGGKGYHLNGFNIDDASINFWKKDTSHNSIIEVLIDTTMTKSEKDAICADLVRISEQFNHVNAYEMPYQLEMGPHSAYTSLTTMAYQDQPSILSDIESSTNKIRKSFETSYEDLRDQIRQLRKRSNPGDLDARIKYLANNPQAFCDINIDIVVDAIDEQLDKSSKSSEKAHAENSVNAFYESLCIQRGGYTNALYRSDDRVLGFIAEDQLTRFDVIKALADPDFSITVYGDNGRWVLSRKNLCGANSEKALWDTLEKHPRMALMLRNHLASIDGNATYENASSSIDAIVDQDSKKSEEMKGRIFSELINHPMFLAMCALYSPAKGISARSNREVRRATINEIRRLICHLAKKSVYQKEPIDPKDVLEKMGTTVESLVETGGFDQESAEKTYQDICDALQKYIALVGKIIREGDYRQYISEFDFSDHVLRFDKTSASLFRDVRQTMNGAQTEKATSIEGGMTQRNTGIALYFMSRKDRYTTLDKSDSKKYWESCYGCMTNAGEILTAENADELYERMGDTPLVVELQEGRKILDPTLDRNGNQISAIARFTTIKRSKAAEDNNLKAKKSGDDGTDLVVKTQRYDNNASNNISDVYQAYENASEDFKMFAAKCKLAEILMHNDVIEGYKDLTYSDYVNIASELILEEPIGGTIIIRSAEEISYALRRRIPQSILDNGNPKDIIRAAEEIALGVGVYNNEENTPVYMASQRNALHSIVARIRPSIDGKFKPAKRARSSSFDRSFEMMWKIRTENKIKFPWTGEEIDKKSKSILSKAVINQVHREISKRTKLNDTFKNNRTSYKMLGLITTKGKSIMRISPGPSSVWILEEDATPDQVNSALKNCYAYGMTLAFRKRESLKDFQETFENDIIPAPFGEDMYMLPFFDMRMNGSSLSVPMAPASFQLDPSSIVFTVHSRNNLYGQGDASMLGSKSLFDRSHANASDVKSINLESMFFNTFNEYSDYLNYEITGGPIQLATHEEIERDIINWQDDGPVIDIGIAGSNENIDRVVQKLGLQVQEYRDNFGYADENGILPEGKPDRIVGWLKCYITGYEDPVYAPIIPSPTGTNLTFPQKFSVEIDEESINTDKWTLDMKWNLTEDLQGQTVKMFEGVGGANKQMMFIDKSVDLGRFRFGRAVDCVIAAASVASRRLGTSARMDTLKTLAYTAMLPPFGFNYADHPSSFPSDPKFRLSTGEEVSIKEALSKKRIPLYGEELSWVNILDQLGSITFSDDPEVNAFLTDQVNLAMQTGTVNPSDILATKYGDAYSFMYVDYDFMFDDTISTQQSLMKYYNSMMPNLCPPNIESYDGTTYFKPCLDSGYAYGSLMLHTPYPSPNGGWSYTWEIVTASLSYFNDDFSAMHKVGINGASRTLEQLNAIAISGQPLQGFNFRQFLRNATSPAQRIRKPHDIELDYGKFLRKDR